MSNGKIINLVSQIGGSALGAVIASFDPSLSVLGAACSPGIAAVIEWLLNETKEKFFSKREKTNISKALIYANDSVSEESPELSENWLARYIDAVKDVSGDDLLLVWGKILSQQINNKESISLRTIETIKNISLNEAETFERIMPFIFFNSHLEPVLPQCKFLSEQGIAFNDILKLIDAGLLSNSASLNFLPTKEEHKAFCSKDYLILMEAKTSLPKKVVMNIFPLTKAGFDLVSVLTWHTSLDMAKKLCNELSEIYKDSVSFSVKRRIGDCSGGCVTYTNLEEH